MWDGAAIDIAVTITRAQGRTLSETSQGVCDVRVGPVDGEQFMPAHLIYRLADYLRRRWPDEEGPDSDVATIERAIQKLEQLV